VYSGHTLTIESFYTSYTPDNSRRPFEESDIDLYQPSDNEHVGYKHIYIMDYIHVHQNLDFICCT